MTYKRKLSEFRKKYVRFNVSEQRRKLKLKAIEYKGGSCKHCGYNKCPGAMIFHHLDPSQKDFTISHGQYKSFNKILSELDKCILLCSNCHAETHAKEHEINRIKKLKEIENEKIKHNKFTNKSVNKQCFNCLIDIKVFNSRLSDKNFCSRKCRDDSLNNEGWPSNVELLKLSKEMPIKNISEILNKSLPSIYQRLKKINKLDR